MGVLYIVATPIGNLEDITLRAIRTLREVDLIFAEDTRVTKRLLNKYEIDTPVKSMNARTESAISSLVVAEIQEGSSVAYVSDAGTPGISDPGEMLVSLARGAGLDVITIPGPSALTSALSIAGIPAIDFLFLGFLPHKKGRQTLFKEIAQSKRTVVFYESPHRIMKALGSLSEHVGERKITIARELTKIYEEVLVGTATELTKILIDTPEKQKGEFVVIVSR